MIMSSKNRLELVDTVLVEDASTGLLTKSMLSR